MRLHLPLIAAAALAGPAVAADGKLRFNRDIRPILSDNCFACHGPDANHRKADLRLDVREKALDAGVIEPGEPGDSELVARLFKPDTDRLRMPPPDSHKSLTPEQKDKLKRWVAEGAEYEGHWAYQPVRRPDVPHAGLTPPARPESAVDAFILARLGAAGLTHAPEADRRTLARRLAFDLTGLPPTPEAVAAFAADPSPDAYDRYVDGLLASPHYGERMALQWLDWVRFADTIGYHSDTPHNVWPYRDWVVRSFNDNKPFDRFTVEQLAGDLLPDAGRDTRVASCYNMLLLTTEEGGAQAKDYEARMLADRVRALGSVWLGQTLGCCQCHDHKYDPSGIRDFYAVGAFFADIQEPIIAGRPPGMLVATPDQEAELAGRRAVADRAKRGGAALAGAAAARRPAEAADKAAKDYVNGLVRCMTAESGRPRTVRVLPRGNWMDESGPAVDPATPAYLPNAPSPAPGKRLTRLDLARWVASPDNPLTARVFVNRVWKQLFGAGLSRTADDFGSQGDPPSHPELLDWLAADFTAHGWDVKRLIGTIARTRTYRQSSVPPPAALAADPDNRLVSRQGRFRLDAEFVRDNALAVSGLLVPRVGGPSVKPYQPDGYWENLNFPTRKYHPDRGESQYRRGLYVWRQRTFPHPSLLAFDAPSREECACDRPRSNIPQQALALLNDPTYVEAARALAARVLAAGGPDTAARVDWAFRRVLQRAPKPDEARVVAALVDKHAAEYRADPKAADAVLAVGFAPRPKHLDAADLAAWTNAARVLLNLHETVTRN